MSEFNLRNVDVDNIDLSEHEKDYTPEELAAVRAALSEAKRQQLEQFDKLPITDKAKYYASDIKQSIEENPDLWGAGTSLGLAAAGGAGAAYAVPKLYGKAQEQVGKIHESVRDMIAEGVQKGMQAQQQPTAGAPTAQPAAPAITPENPMITPEQAAARVQQMPEHPNPITQVDTEVLSQVGSSEKAAQTKELDANQKTASKVTGGVVPNETGPVVETKVKTAVKPPQQHTFATMEEALAKNPEMVFVPKAGGADNWLEKQFGPETRKHIRELFNEGQHYGGGQSAMNKAYADVKQYGQWLKENVPVQTLDRDERKALGVPPLKEYPTLGKTVKIAGAVGLLAAAHQAANAAQRGDYSEAAKIGVPAALGTVSQTAGGLASAVAEPELAATDLSRMSPMIGMLSKILLANEKKKK